MSDIPITVLMPAYNAEKYLGNAINSILSQTYEEFEFLIINDGSTDHTQEILESYRDPRIKILHQDNKGIGATLNIGIQLAEGKYIARMDADDESIPKRLEIQKQILDENPEGVFVYGLHDVIDEQGNILKTEQGRDFSDTISKWLLIWSNFIIHPTVMIRKAVLEKKVLCYQQETNGAEDFDLWSRLARVGDILSTPKVVLRYRVHKESITWVDSKNRQFQIYFRIIMENFERYGIKLSEGIAEELAVISGGTGVNPITYQYRHLTNQLLPLLEDISIKFVEATSGSRKDLLSIQSEQLLKWARCMLHVSKTSALKFFFLGFRSSNQIAFSGTFWLIFLAMFFPKKSINWINRKRTRTLI
jgi:glycosyltransferase involved in cell wall biosynthesis